MPSSSPPGSARAWCSWSSSSTWPGPTGRTTGPCSRPGRCPPGARAERPGGGSVARKKNDTPAPAPTTCSPRGSASPWSAGLEALRLEEGRTESDRHEARLVARSARTLRPDAQLRDPRAPVGEGVPRLVACSEPAPRHVHKKLGIRARLLDRLGGDPDHVAVCDGGAVVAPSRSDRVGDREVPEESVLRS